jgi:competence protein ComEA
VRLPPRRSDDADVIRARLRALLAEGSRPGWVPDDPAAELADDDEPEVASRWPAATPPPCEPDDVPIAGRHRAPGPAVRLDPGRPGARALLAAAATAVLLLLIWTWWQRPTADAVPVGDAPSTERSPHPSASADAVPSPSVGEVAETSTTLVVSVVGLVAEPGLVTLSSGARVADAVEAAGGLRPEADPASVNLAALVADGQQVAVGVPPAAGDGTPAAAPAPAGGGPVNLNTADVGGLDALPGIGPVLAQRIVEHREQHGPFGAVEDLQDVPGIGPAILDGLGGGATV